jgi:SAM-dependent methyltransferase
MSSGRRGRWADVRARLRSGRQRRILRARRQAKHERFHELLIGRHPAWSSAIDLRTTDEGLGPVVYAMPRDTAAFGVKPVDAVSANEYDGHALSLIDEYRDGLVLDCGAGYRENYLHNVINLEIVPYESTDIIAVAEQVPLRDESVDAVISSAVLEHVRHPWLAARELGRILKPGGALYVAVPFLQPLHGYPNHYFNMTGEGLASLFGGFEITWHEVIDSLHPIWALTWILRSWRDGLSGPTREAFEDMRVAELIGEPLEYLGRPFAAELSREKRFELAAGTALLARKPGPSLER